MPAVQLVHGNPNPFKRAIRGPEGDVKRMLVFPPGEVVDLSTAEFAVIRPDIVKGMLIETAPDARGRQRPKKPEPAPMVEMPAAQYEAELDAAKAAGREEALAELAEPTSGNGDDSPAED